VGRGEHPTDVERNTAVLGPAIWTALHFCTGAHKKILKIEAGEAESMIVLA